jgi:hypothetical protein
MGEAQPGGAGMSMEAVKGLRGQELALCRCQFCAAEVTVPAQHGTSNGFSKGGAGRSLARLTLQHEGKVLTAIAKLGWSNIAHKLRCPKCEEERRAKQPTAEGTEQMEPKASKVTPLRSPTADMELDIIEALLSCYDRKAKRYSGQETDASVAEAVGSGCMPGWVASIREAKFGPAGNAEVEAIRREIAELRATLHKSLDELVKRLDACVAAHDKRVGSK